MWDALKWLLATPFILIAAVLLAVAFVLTGEHGESMSDWIDRHLSSA